MLFGNLDCCCFDKHLPAELLKFLRGAVDSLPNGKTVLIPDRMWVSVFETEVREAGKENWEAHREFADLQMVIDGGEYCLLDDMANCVSTKPYDAAGDCEMFTHNAPECQSICLLPGKALLIPALLVHLPAVVVPSCPGKHRKLVAKIHQSLLGRCGK